MVSERVGLVNSAARSESLFADGERNKVGKFGWLGGSDANVRGRRDAEQQCSRKQSDRARASGSNSSPREELTSDKRIFSPQSLK